MLWDLQERLFSKKVRIELRPLLPLQLICQLQLAPAKNCCNLLSKFREEKTTKDETSWRPHSSQFKQIRDSLALVKWLQIQVKMRRKTIGKRVAPNQSMHQRFWSKKKVALSKIILIKMKWLLSPKRGRRNSCGFLMSGKFKHGRTRLSQANNLRLYDWNSNPILFKFWTNWMVTRLSIILVPTFYRLYFLKLS